jgi:hypothetical protein
VNYFAHAIRFLDADPHFIAGTAVPDWMSVADRKVRVRAKFAEPLVADSPDELTRCVARGALQHLHDDGWFHGTRAFAEVTGDLSRRFRECLGPDDPMRCGFLGHVVTELLLDAALIEREPARLDLYYQRLEDIDAAAVESAVNQMSRGETQRLKLLIPLFHRERFLYDYVDDARLLWRLNRVLERVRLPTLPDHVVEVLAASREVVRLRSGDLLPVEHFHDEN